jgi:hypothetical protein
VTCTINKILPLLPVHRLPLTNQNEEPIPHDNKITTKDLKKGTINKILPFLPAHRLPLTNQNEELIPHDNKITTKDLKKGRLRGKPPFYRELKYYLLVRSSKSM